VVLLVVRVGHPGSAYTLGGYHYRNADEEDLFPMPDDTASDTTEHQHHGYISAKDDYRKRLRRIEGQARGLQRMVEDEEYCIDILTQVSAMTKALQAVSMGLLEDHLRHCVTDAVAQGGPAAEEKIQEATLAIKRLVRS
jgi:DNA-binding FrmR family transcriptional regulator